MIDYLRAKARARARERERLHRGLLSIYKYVYVGACVCMFFKCVRVHLRVQIWVLKVSTAKL